MKYEWKKQARDCYGAGVRPMLINVPRQRFIIIAGEGDPNADDFSQRVGVLYSLAYAVKMRFKKQCDADEAFRRQYPYDDYAVYPLEGVWSTANPEHLSDKSSFQYTIMIRQPDFITGEMYDDAFAAVEQKKPRPYLKEVACEPMEDGKCVQILHRGAFDNEPESFSKLDAFAQANGLKRRSAVHREIYLNDARRTAPEKRRTILRYQVMESDKTPSLQ